MESLSALLEKRTTAPTKRVTERGELLKYFASKLDKKISYVAFKVSHLALPDLYYIQSICNSYEREGNPWAKAFYGSLKPR